jgi:hypothetical protein
MVNRTTTFPTFEELNKKYPQFFRVGKAGAWRKEMSGFLHRLFWRHHETAMREMGYV